MGLFSRRSDRDDRSGGSKRERSAPEPVPGEGVRGPGEEEPGTPEAESAPQTAEEPAVPHVPISVTTYGKASSRPVAASDGAGSDAAKAAKAAAGGAVPAKPIRRDPDPAPIPGLRDNLPLRDALEQLTGDANPPAILNVVRQVLQGTLFLRVKGDLAALRAAGKSVPLAIANHNGKKLVLVFSGGRALKDAIAKDGDTSTGAVGQPAETLLRAVLAGEFDGIAIDHASSPASVVLPRAILEKAFADLEGSPVMKNALTAPRSASTAGEIAALLLETPVWIAARKLDNGQVGVAEGRTADGERYLEVFSHPLELLVLARGDQPVRLGAAQLSAALRADEALSGIVLDPKGPSMRLRREDLGLVLAVEPPA